MSDTSFRNKFALIDSQISQPENTWGASLTNHGRVLSSEEGNLIVEFTVKEEHCNPAGNLHGGCIATLIDVYTSWAINTFPDRKYFQYLGVSVVLSVEYVSAARIGETIIIESKVVKLGKSLANLDAMVREKETGRVIATGTHTKFSLDPKL